MFSQLCKSHWGDCKKLSCPSTAAATTAEQGFQELWECEEESFKDPQNADVEETSAWCCCWLPLLVSAANLLQHQHKQLPPRVREECRPRNWRKVHTEPGHECHPKNSGWSGSDGVLLGLREESQRQGFQVTGKLWIWYDRGWQCPCSWVWRLCCTTRKTACFGSYEWIALQ